MLYKTSERLGLASELAFTRIEASPAYAHPAKDETGFWPVRNQGRLSFVFSIARMKEGKLSDVDDRDFGTFLERYLELVTVRPSLKTVMPLLVKWRETKGLPKEQDLLLDALADDFTFPLAALRLLCRGLQGAADVSGKVLQRILPVLEGGSGAFYEALLFVRSPKDYVN
jgi:hypothetical protein